MPHKALQPSKLVAAIRSGRLSGVIRAIEDGADIEEADIHGVCGLPLRTACFEGSMAIVRELLRAGANINAMAIDGPGAPLRLALRGGHGEIAAFLLQNGAETPPGLLIDQAILNQVGSLSPLPGEAPVPTLPEPALVDSLELTKPALDFAIEEVEVPSCYGTDTNLLTLDLLEIDEATADNGPGPSKQPQGKLPAKQSGFWKSSRSS
jgi:hypothetical protein